MKMSQAMVEIGTNAVVVAFSNDGQIVSATGGCSVERWQVKDSDGQEVGRLGSVNTTGAACAVATSKDGRWIVHADGQAVVVRNAATYPGREVFRIEEHTKPVYALDISPDSTQFASGSLDYTMRVYSITTGQRLLGPIQHEHDMLHGVKFSPSGEYIATATMHRVRVLNANTGHQLCEIPSHPITQPWAPLGWSSDSKRLFAIKEDGKVMCLDVSNSKLIREWGLPINRPGFCCLATNGRSFIACSTPSSLSFWDTSSYTRIGSTIEGRGPIYSMAVSSDDRYLACCETGKITIYSLKDILPRDILLLGPSTIRLPLVELSNTAFKPWIEGNWESAEAILSQEIGSRGQHILANRALVRTHLKQWDAAIEDAKASLAIQLSPIAHIAHALALLGRNGRTSSMQAFDLAFCDCNADDIKFLLLIKAVLLFISRESEDGITRVNDLIAVVDVSAKYNYYQVLGTMYRKQGDDERANQSFELAQSFSSSRQGRHLETISLIFGKDFDGLTIDP